LLLTFYNYTQKYQNYDNPHADAFTRSLTHFDAEPFTSEKQVNLKLQ